MKKNVLRTANLVLFALLLLLCVCMGVLQTPMADDFWYSLHVRPFSAFFHYEYFQWSGRIFNDFFMYFATHGRITYFLSGIATGASFFVAVYGILACALGRFPQVWKKEKDCLLFLLVFASLWFILPDLAETCFWKAGFGSYLGPATMGVWFLFPYINRLCHPQPKPKSTWLSCVLFVLLGFFAGSAQEQLAVCLGIAVFCILIQMIRKHRLTAVPGHLFAGYIAFVIGAVVLLLAPGNAIRQKSIPKVSGTYSPHQVLYQIKLNLVQTTLHLQNLWPLLLIVGIAVVCTVLLRLRGCHHLYLPWKSALFWLIISAFAVIPLVYTGSESMALSGVRVYFTFLMFVVLAAATLLRNVASLENVCSSVAIRMVNLAFTVLLFIPLFFAVKSSFRLLAQFDVRDQLVADAKAKGKTDVAVPPLTVDDSRVTFLGGDGVDSWMGYEASVFGMRSIRVDSSLTDDYQQIHARIRFWQSK